jgi:hypothetical protein
MRRLLLFAGVATASAAVQLTDIYGGQIHMRHFQSRMVKDARDTGVIVLTLTAYNYARAFANFKYITKKLSTTTPAVLAYDDASKCAFDALGVAAVRVRQPKRWSRNRFFIVLKTHPTLLALKAGYRVIFSEMDIFWLRDPLEFVQTRNVSRIFRNCSEPADMLVAKHRHGHEANYGFFIANSTDAVLILCGNRSAS